MKRLILTCVGAAAALALLGGTCSPAAAQDRDGDRMHRDGMRRDGMRAREQRDLLYPDMPWYYQVRPGNEEFFYGARMDQVHCALRADWYCFTDIRFRHDEDDDELRRERRGGTSAPGTRRR